MSDGPRAGPVVGDAPDAREFLTTVLRDNGYKAVTANDGAQAIERIEQELPGLPGLPDLVALDITMPEKSGVAVYRRLKEEDRFNGIPVIIAGVSDDFRKFIPARRQVPPPEGCISKPADREQFLAVVGELLG